jgi:hypothetical protein
VSWLLLLGCRLYVQLHKPIWMTAKLTKRRNQQPHMNQGRIFVLLLLLLLGSFLTEAA